MTTETETQAIKAPPGFIATHAHGEDSFMRAQSVMYFLDAGTGDLALFGGVEDWHTFKGATPSDLIKKMQRAEGRVRQFAKVHNGGLNEEGKEYSSIRSHPAYTIYIDVNEMAGLHFLGEGVNIRLHRTFDHKIFLHMSMAKAVQAIFGDY